MGMAAPEVRRQGLPDEIEDFSLNILSWWLEENWPPLERLWWDFDVGFASGRS
jgi:hypothetical protein